MTTQQTKKMLMAKQVELRSSQIRREDIAIVKNAEVLDEIQQNADRTLALDSMTRNWETASLVSEALYRLEEGSYGTCAECDEEISAKRLAAIPWAKYCIACQERADHSSTDTDWAKAA
jgi:DnaK suppressor protein